MSVEIQLLDKAIQWSATGFVSVIMTSTWGYIRSMSASISSLNISTAQILERSVFLEKTLDSLSARIQNLEKETLK